MKNDGVEFAIIRAGFGNSISQKDAKYDVNYKGAKDNGMKAGAYWFSYAVSNEDAVKEANVFKNIIKEHSLELPVFFDYEYDSIEYANKQGVTITKEKATEMTKAFLAEMKAGGYTAGLYTNPDFLKNWFDISQLSGYPVWLAKWVDNAQFDNPPAEYGEIVCWQHTSKGKISGIAGNVDMNYGYFKNLESTPVSTAPVNPVASVTASLLNVRSGPGAGHSILRTLSKGNLVDVLESYTNGWSKINIAGLTAYVNHKYLSVYKQPLVELNATPALQAGAKVMVKKGAKTYEGVSLASFVYSTMYTVMQVNGDRVVIGRNNVVTAAVHKNNLIQF